MFVIFPWLACSSVRQTRKISNVLITFQTTRVVEAAVQG